MTRLRNHEFRHDLKSRGKTALKVGQNHSQSRMRDKQELSQGELINNKEFSGQKAQQLLGDQVITMMRSRTAPVEVLSSAPYTQTITRNGLTAAASRCNRCNMQHQSTCMD